MRTVDLIQQVLAPVTVVMAIMLAAWTVGATAFAFQNTKANGEFYFPQEP